MTLSEISIRRPVFAWMLMSALIIFGGIAFNRLGVSQLPDVDFPVISVAATLEGASPEVIETEVSDIIEEAVFSLQGVRSVSSSSRAGRASISIEFDLEQNIDLALQEVQARLSQAVRKLPKDMDPPVVSKTNPEDQPILWLSVSSDRHPVPELMTYVRDRLKDQFARISGVGEVFLGGYSEPNLRVWLDDQKLKSYALTSADVIRAIQDEHGETPAGRIESSSREQNVRLFGEAKDVPEFSNLMISTRGGSPNFNPIPLSRVARVEEGLEDVRRISRVNGKPGVGLGIRKQRGSNAVAVANEVKAKMEEVSKQLPEGMNIGVNFDGTRFIEENVHELNFNLILSAILTSLVCFFFLVSWSSTLNILMAIPTSVVGSFLILYFSGFTLNTFTLLALSLSVGIVVDDAIMVLENIIRHKEMGKSKVQAALDGAKEITFAALAATVSIIAIFLPVAFMDGVIGKFFFQFGVTLSCAVALSLVEALTLAPMRCSQFLESGTRDTRLGKISEAFFNVCARTYSKGLHFTLRNRWKVVLGSILFFVASMVLVKWVNKEFTPAQDQGRFLMRLQTAVGSSIQFTDEKTKEAEKILMSHPAVQRVFVAVGGFGGGEVNSAVAFVTLKPKNERPPQSAMMAEFRKSLNAIPGVKAIVQDLSLRGFTASRGFPVEFTVRGPDWERLAEYSEKLTEEIKKLGTVIDLDTDYELGMPEVQIMPNRTRAKEYGVSVQDIANVLQTMVGGVVVGKYTKDGRRFDIRVRLEDDRRDQSQKIKSLFVRNNRGELVGLDKVVEIKENRTLQSISRKDRERAVSVFGNLKPGASQADVLNSIEALSKRVLPEGYRIVLGGSSETFKESFRGLVFALILGVVIAYMILASQFNSYVHPITVLIALPFSLSGAFVALWATGYSLNIFSFIGLILLMGIVKKNSILLVEFTNQVHENEKLPVNTALLKACPIRLRPILMTSIATIVAAIPPALAIGPGEETRIPMAVAVIGGAVVSTLLTLFVVPAVYSLFARERSLD